MKNKPESKHQYSQKRGQIRVSLLNAKEYLGHGDYTAIAKESGVTTKTVNNVLNGRRTNWTVAEKILDRAERNKAIKERAESI
jgi:hypothetical protein